MRRLFLAFCLFGILSCTNTAGDEPAHFVTWQGIGPDKWASVWLIKRHINPDAVIQFIPVNSTPAAGTSFDIPGAPYYRGKTTTFEQMIHAYNLQSNQSLLRMIDIVHDIEITPWGGLRNESSQTIEIAFRGMQERYGRENVNETCYMAMFDAVFEGYPKPDASFDPSACQEQDRDSQNIPPAIPTMGISDILSAMQKGKKVVFLDAREAEEFKEGHIPGAINVKLRDINEEIARQYLDADLLVPYCVKDFRGYEVARSLFRYGNAKAVIMQPFGLKGWSSLDLPLQGELKLSKAEASQAMSECIRIPENCLGASL
jgi:rhodanese-related sulfurtransferase